MKIGLLASAGEPPAGKQFELPSVARFQLLRERVESEWVPQLRARFDLSREALPAIWDIDFLYGPKSPSGEDSYLLCEINASSTFAFPEHAMPVVAAAAIERIRERGAKPPCCIVATPAD